MSDFIDWNVPDEFVTKGATRPALVLRSNDDGTKDVLVFYHPEDRQPMLAEAQLRQGEDRFKAAGPAAPQGERTTPSGEGVPAGPPSPPQGRPVEPPPGGFGSQGAV